MTLLSLLATQTAGRWGLLWISVPVAVAASLLAGWRFGVRGVIVPLACFGLVLGFAGPWAMWAWWIPVASLTGLWMGLREEGEGPTLGERSWMLLPVLLLAAGLPWALSYPGLVRAVDRELLAGDTALLQLTRQMG